MPLPVAGMAGPDGPVRPGPVHGREGVQPATTPAAEGFFGRVKVESVHLRALGGAYVRGGRRTRRRVHPLVQPFEDQTVAGMEKPGRIQNKPGAGRIGKQLQENVRSP